MLIFSPPQICSNQVCKAITRSRAGNQLEPVLAPAYAINRGKIGYAMLGNLAGLRWWPFSLGWLAPGNINGVVTENLLWSQQSLPPQSKAQEMGPCLRRGTLYR